MSGNCDLFTKLTSDRSLAHLEQIPPLRQVALMPFWQHGVLV